MSPVSPEVERQRIRDLGVCVHCKLRARGPRGDRLCISCRRKGVSLRALGIALRKWSKPQARAWRPKSSKLLDGEAYASSDRIEDLRRGRDLLLRELAK